MKKYSLLFFLPVFMLFLSFAGQAQINTPAASSAAMFKQTVGLTEVSAEYARPNVKGRTIFAKDGLVPFGEIWRTGANAATKISFSDDVKVGGADVKAGDYAILTKPNATEWQVMMFPYEGRSWGSYVEKNPAASFAVATKAMDHKAESFTIAVNNVATTSATIDIMWDKTMVSIPLEVDVDTKVMADIERVMAGPSAADYYAAGTYYHESGKDLNKALEMVQKATKVDNPRFWQVRREALILADLKRTKEAITTAKLSMELAEKAGNQDYVRMNKKSIAEWSKM